MTTAPTPFVTILTPTYRRPQQLARCLASVSAQTAVDDLEQIVLPDHVGRGIVGGLFERLPWYATAVHGRYVNILADDDLLAHPTVVEHVRAFADATGHPPVVVVRVLKAGLQLPVCDPEGPPICGQVDLTSFVVRADVWQRHVHDYGRRYEGDYDHAQTLWRAGYPFRFCDVLWAVGGASHGRPEVGA